MVLLVEAEAVTDGLMRLSNEAGQSRRRQTWMFKSSILQAQLTCQTEYREEISVGYIDFPSSLKFLRNSGHSYTKYNTSVPNLDVSPQMW